MPPRRRALLLPPQHPQTRHRKPPPPLPALSLRPASAGGSLRHSILHRSGPAAHSLQRHRLTPRRSPPLRPPDREPQPAPRPLLCPHNHARNRHSRRGHPRSLLRPTRSSLGSRTSHLASQPRRCAARPTCPQRKVRRIRTRPERHCRPNHRAGRRSTRYPPGRPRLRPPSRVLLAISPIEPSQSSQPCHASPEQARSDPRPPSHVQMEDSACDTREPP
jgi:hypothetical protein